MSGRDRTTGAARPWRLFGRALVVAGATVAGTSAAWLLGHGPADAAEDVPAAEAADHTPEQATDSGRSGPEEFSLTRLDPLRLVDSSAAELLDAARPVTEVLQQPAAEVEQVAGDALAVTTGTATGTDAGSGPEVPPPPPVAPAPPLDAAPPAESPVQSAADTHTGPAPSAAAPQRTAPPAAPPAPEPPVQPGAPVGSTPFVLPSAPGAPGLGGAFDGSHHTTTALGWYPAAPLCTPAFAGTVTCDLAGTVVSVPEPQPGTTPD